MEGSARLVTAGRVGKPHGLDGGFALRDPVGSLSAGDEVAIGDRVFRIERRWGSDDRPLVRLEGVDTREAAGELTGELVLIADELEADEWLAEDLIGCTVEGVGKVKRIVGGSSCDVLELEDGRLVPLISDAIHSIDTERGSIEIDMGFLGE